MGHNALAAVAVAMRPADWFNLAGLILGPLLAVLITSSRERKLRACDQQMRILGLLMANRAAPGGVDWDSAFSLVPLHYNGNNIVLTAWRDLLANFNTRAAPGNEQYHLQERLRKTNHLLFVMASALRIKVTEAEIASEAYISNGTAERNVAIRVIPNALASIADTLKSQLEYLKNLKS